MTRWLGIATAMLVLAAVSAAAQGVDENEPLPRFSGSGKLVCAEVDQRYALHAAAMNAREINLGLGPSGWHWTWERHGAPQLNQRFDREAAREMADEDWAAWAAVRSVVDAITRSGTSEPAVLRAALVADDLTLDTYKGAAGSFRPWNRQLRQPMLLHTHNAVVARAPLPEFLHATNTLDSLGVDRAESRCVE